jgi:hypothetical protein
MVCTNMHVRRNIVLKIGRTDCLEGPSWVCTDTFGAKGHTGSFGAGLFSGLGFRMVDLPVRLLQREIVPAASGTCNQVPRTGGPDSSSSQTWQRLLATPPCGESPLIQNCTFRKFTPQ